MWACAVRSGRTTPGRVQALWELEETHVMGMTLWRNSWGVHGPQCDGESIPSDAMSGELCQATHARATGTCTSAYSSHPVPMQRHIPVLMQVVGMWRMPHAPAPGLGLSLSLLALFSLLRQSVGMWHPGHMRRDS